MQVHPSRTEARGASGFCSEAEHPWCQSHRPVFLPPAQLLGRPWVSHSTLGLTWPFSVIPRSPPPSQLLRSRGRMSVSQHASPPPFRPYLWDPGLGTSWAFPFSQNKLGQDLSFHGIQGLGVKHRGCTGPTKALERLGWGWRDTGVHWGRALPSVHNHPECSVFSLDAF